MSDVSTAIVCGSHGKREEGMTSYSVQIEYAFARDNTHPSGVSVVTLKIAGMTDTQLLRLERFVGQLALEQGQIMGEGEFVPMSSGPLLRQGRHIGEKEKN